MDLFRVTGTPVRRTGRVAFLRALVAAGQQSAARLCAPATGCELGEVRGGSDLDDDAVLLALCREVVKQGPGRLGAVAEASPQLASCSGGARRHPLNIHTWLPE